MTKKYARGNTGGIADFLLDQYMRDKNLIPQQGFEYSRSNNPNRQSLETNIASLEGGKWSYAFSSGSACTASVISLLKSNDHVIVVDDVYGGTYRYFSLVGKTYDISFEYLDLVDATLFEPRIRPNTRMLWVESPTNPLLKVIDVEYLARVAHRHDILVVVDNTLMSPYNSRPLEFGADLVVHSATKFINGHCDVVMGLAITNDEDLAKRLKYVQNSLGAIPSAFDCYLVLRSVKTLSLRLERHNKNAQTVAEFLETHSKVERVIYPGLRSNPQHALAKRMFYGFGGILSIYLKVDDMSSVNNFLKHLRIFVLAESMGGVESLINHPASMTHASIPVERRNELGITDNLLRVSIGIEDVEDLVEDLKFALSFV